jgi:hypothetical protein
LISVQLFNINPAYFRVILEWLRYGNLPKSSHDVVNHINFPTFLDQMMLKELYTDYVMSQGLCKRVVLKVEDEQLHIVSQNVNPNCLSLVQTLCKDVFVHPKNNCKTTYRRRVTWPGTKDVFCDFIMARKDDRCSCVHFDHDYVVESMLSGGWSQYKSEKSDEMIFYKLV